MLLTRRPVEPLKNEWSLMGGFMEEQESLHQAAEKILYRYTELGNIYMEQVGAYGELHRDSGGRVISVAYYALVQMELFDTPLAKQSMPDGSISTMYPYRCLITTRWFGTH